MISKSRAIVQNDFSAHLDIPKVLIELSMLSTREAGWQYLQSLNLTREGYSVLVRNLDIPVDNRDTKERLQTKIINGTIGYRIRASIIQNAL